MTNYRIKPALVYRILAGLTWLLAIIFALTGFWQFEMIAKVYADFGKQYPYSIVFAPLAVVAINAGIGLILWRRAIILPNNAPFKNTVWTIIWLFCVQIVNTIIVFGAAYLSLNMLSQLIV